MLYYVIDDMGYYVQTSLISVVASRDVIWRLTELLLFLTKLADSSIEIIKYELYERHSLKAYLSRILFNGNSIEKEYALKLLWKLSLDKHVADSIRNDLNLYSFLVGLSMNQFNRNRILIKYANCILFALNNSSTTTSTNGYATNNHTSATTPVMRTTSTRRFPSPINVTSSSSSSSFNSSYASSRLFVTDEVEFLKI